MFAIGPIASRWQTLELDEVVPVLEGGFFRTGCLIASPDGETHRLDGDNRGRRLPVTPLPRPVRLRHASNRILTGLPRRNCRPDAPMSPSDL